MRQNAPNLLLFIVLSAAAYGIFWAGEKWLWPPKPKPEPEPRKLTLKEELKGALAGATIFEEAFLRAGWARAQSQTASANLFTIEKVADGVFAALRDRYVA